MDPLGLAASAVGSAVASGLAAVSATTLVVDTMRPVAGAQPNLGAAFYVLFLGTFAGIALAGAVAWRLLAPIPSTYRRGGLALVSAFATVIAMLVCIPVNQFLGQAGLAGLIALALLASALLARRARTAGAAP
jgi:hypothetical protein